MPYPWASRVAFVASLIGMTGFAPRSGRAQALEPIIYNLKVPAPDTHIVEVEAIIPAGKGPSIEIMMATWSPGFYRVEDYAKRVQGSIRSNHGRRTAGSRGNAEEPLANSDTREAQGRCLLSAALRTVVGDHQLRR